MHVQQASPCSVPAGQLIGELAGGKCGEEPAFWRGWPRRALVSAGLCPRGCSWSPPAALPGRQVAFVGGVLPDAPWPDCQVFKCWRALTLLCFVPGERSIRWLSWPRWGSVGPRGWRDRPALRQSGRSRSRPCGPGWSAVLSGRPCCRCGRAVALLGVPRTVPVAALSSVCFGREGSSGPRAACPWPC